MKGDELTDILEYFRSQESPSGVLGLAKAMNVSRGAIYRWKEFGLPPWRLEQIRQLIRHIEREKAAEEAR